MSPARLHVVDYEDVVADAEKHVNRRRQRTAPELSDLLDVAFGAAFVTLILANGYALVLGWIEIIARVFGGG